MNKPVNDAMGKASEGVPFEDGRDVLPEVPLRSFVVGEWLRRMEGMEERLRGRLLPMLLLV